MLHRTSENLFYRKLANICGVVARISKKSAVARRHAFDEVGRDDIPIKLLIKVIKIRMRPPHKDNNLLAVGGHYIGFLGKHPVEATTALH